VLEARARLASSWITPDRFITVRRVLVEGAGYREFARREALR
jgi:hypothetical protein